MTWIKTAIWSILSWFFSSCATSRTIPTRKCDRSAKSGIDLLRRLISESIALYAATVKHLGSNVTGLEGSYVGLSEGESVTGDRVGVVVGTSVRDSVGESVIGDCVGDSVGEIVIGENVSWDSVGESVIGDCVGYFVGEIVIGENVGVLVGRRVGFREGRFEGELVGSRVED